MSDLEDPQTTASRPQSVGAVLIFEKMFEIFKTGNMQAMIDLMADDAIMEFPFAPPKRPRQVKGKDSIIKYNQEILRIVAFSGMKDVEIYRTSDPDCVIVEMTGYGTILATGDAFERRYIEVCRTENGLIKLIRDYWNPQDTPRLSFGKKLKVAHRMLVEKGKSRRQQKVAQSKC